MATKPVLTKVAYFTGHWWLALGLGILFIATGIWVLRTPLESYTALAMLFAIIILANGCSEIFSAFMMRNEQSGWGWVLAGGMLDFAIGALLLSAPLTSMVILAFYIGFGLLFRSMMAIGVAFDLRRSQDEGWGWILLIGVAGMLLSLLLIRNPAFIGMTVVFWTGLAFIAIGIFKIVLALRLRKLHKRVAEFV